MPSEQKPNGDTAGGGIPGALNKVLNLAPTAALAGLAAAVPPIGLPLLAIAMGTKVGSLNAKYKEKADKEKQQMVGELISHLSGRPMPQLGGAQGSDGGLLDVMQLLPGIMGNAPPQQRQQPQQPTVSSQGAISEQLISPSNAQQAEQVGSRRMVPAQASPPPGGGSSMDFSPPQSLAPAEGLATLRTLGKVDLGGFKMDLSSYAEGEAIRSVNQLVQQGASPAQALGQYQGIISPENQRVMGQVYAAEVFQQELARIASNNPRLTREQVTEMARINTFTLTGGFGVPEALQDPIFASQLSPETRAELELGGMRPELAAPTQKRDAQARAQQRAADQRQAESKAGATGTYEAELEEYVPLDERKDLVDTTTGQEPTRPVQRGETVGAPGFTPESGAAAQTSGIAPARAPIPPIPLVVNGQEIQFRARRDRPLAIQQASVIYQATAVAILEEAEDVLMAAIARKQGLSGFGAGTAQAVRERVPGGVRENLPFIGTTPDDFAAKTQFKFLVNDYLDAMLRAKSGAQTGELELERLRNLGPSMALDEEANLLQVRNSLRSVRGIAASNIAMNRQLGLEEPDFDAVLAEVIQAREQAGVGLQ